jgi:hypothetical protein
MPSAESEALALATREDGSTDLETYNREYQRALAERQERLVQESQALLRAVDGWRGIETPEDWQRTIRQAAEDLDTGGFLIERIGGQRFVDPPLMAALAVLRRRLIDESGATTAAELMMTDAAVLAYYHTIRINGWVGTLMAATESELFGPSSLTAKLDRRFGPKTEVRGLKVEELMQRLTEQLLPLLDRANRMMLRNLKALSDARRPPSPNLNIGQAAQVNVGAQQVNMAPQPTTGTVAERNPQERKALKPHDRGGIGSADTNQRTEDGPAGKVAIVKMVRSSARG